MPTLDTTIAVYGGDSEAERDWAELEEAAVHGLLQLADAAVVENRRGEAVILQRESRHGWAKGAAVGAVVGILFPPSIIGAAAVGAGGGAVITSLTRALGREEVKTLGETLDSGRTAIVVVSPAGSTNAVVRTLRRCMTMTTVPSATVEELQDAIAGAPRPRV